MKFCIVSSLVSAVCLAQASSSFVVIPTKTKTAAAISRTNTNTKLSPLREQRIGADIIPQQQQQQQPPPQQTLWQRRRFLGDVIASTTAATVVLVGVTVDGSSLTSLSLTSAKANAAMKSDQTVFKAGKDLTVDEARARLRQGQESLDYLSNHYDEICVGGGDNIRRYLGTVGTTSGLYGIAKVMKALQDSVEDIVEYNERMEEVNAALVGADGSAYMAIFTEYSTSGVPKERYFRDAKADIERAIQSMKELAKQADIVR